MNTKALIAVTAGIALGVAGGTAVAGMTATDTTIHACAHKVTGNLRLGTQCRPSEKAVSWDGQGSSGTNVVLREARRTFTVAPVASGEGPAGAGVGCLAGETVVSGGLTGVGADLFPLQIFSTGPSFDGTRSGWNMEWINKTDAPVTATVTMSALCTKGTMTAAP